MFIHVTHLHELKMGKQSTWTFTLLVSHALRVLCRLGEERGLAYCAKTRFPSRGESAR